MNSALQLIESVKEYKVLFVGDTIVDEYHYVTPLGKSAKENLIPVKYEAQEVFRGGVEAAANHLKSFCRRVDVGTSGPITHKVRMIDRDYMRKLFEIHYVQEGNGHIETDIGGYDIVVSADFGHGAIANGFVPKLCEEAQFLAVAAQTNSSNTGFNLITKYPKADYIVIDEPEARLAASDRDGSIEGVMQKLSEGRCNKLVVTHGKYGAYGLEDGHFYHQSAFTDLVRDTMGAGDAFFSITAPMAKTGKMRDLLLIGCAAGAIKTGIVGHRESVTKEKLIEFIKTR